MLLAESEGDLQRVVNEFYSICKRRKLKVNAKKSKVMVFERREVEVRMGQKCCVALCVIGQCSFVSLVLKYMQKRVLVLLYLNRRI